MLACNTQSLNETAIEETQKILDDVRINSSEDLNTISINDFESFLGIDFDTPQNELLNVFGKPSIEEYTQGKEQIKYFWNTTKNVPITTYCDVKTEEVTIILIEILGGSEEFDQDVIRAGENFNIKESHLDLFGKKPSDIINIFGVPYTDNEVNNSGEKDVRDLVYYSSDDRVVVGFMFYPSQGYKLSSIRVDWIR
jgi:hypothetical protein